MSHLSALRGVVANQRLMQAVSMQWSMPLLDVAGLMVSAGCTRAMLCIVALGVRQPPLVFHTNSWDQDSRHC